MSKNNKEPPLAPPASSASSSSFSSASSSSSGEDSSPPRANSPVKKPSADFTVAVLRKHAEPSSKTVAHETRYKDDGSLSKDGSTEDESCEDSGSAVARSNPPLLISKQAGKQAESTSSSDLGSEDGGEDGEEEEDYSSKTAQQPPPPPPPQAAGSTARHNPAVQNSGSDPASEDEFENSSDSNMSAPPPPPPRGSSHRVADPSLMPFNSKPMEDRDDQSAHKIPLSGKRLATPSAQISEKKRRTADIVGADGGQVKKEISRRIWSKVDELSLLQCILDYKENHHVIPTTQVQLKSLLKALNDSLSTSVTLTQMNAKIRLLRNKYNNATKIVQCPKNQHVSDAHSAAVFDLLTKIWGGSNTDSYFLENKIKPEIISSKEIKGISAKPFAAEYPFLHSLLKSELPNNALVFESHMPTAKAKELEEDCKKLERVEIQLHMQKIKLLPSALKLIEDTLVEY